MKSRTSFFNLTALRKNVTRFAPAWALYSVILLLSMLMLGDWHLQGPRYAENLAQTLPFFAVINFFYAALCAQLLFGDLYNSRMCNALHALPMRREGWFLTNAVSGLLFSLVPNTVTAILCMPLVGTVWQVPLLWLAVVTLEYLFFFGAAVLSAYCVGNRFAMGLVYIILNGFSIIALWLVGSIYEPHLYGVVLDEDAFFTFSPVVWLAHFEFLSLPYAGAHYYGADPSLLVFQPEAWGYLGICVVLGLVCLALALVLYRRRNLEAAGDFVAVRGLGPVFLVLYTLCGGACCHGFFDLMLGTDSDLFLYLGFAIGFFTGLMLLGRTVRVFRKKNFLGFGAFVLAFCLSFLLTQTDVLGITRWVPEVSSVKNVTIYTGASYMNAGEGWIDDREVIADIIRVHKAAIENPDAASNTLPDVRLEIQYELNSGRTVRRRYNIDIHTPEGELLHRHLSAPEVVLGSAYRDRETVTGIYLSGLDDRITDYREIQGLLDALIADCQAGTMAQDWAYMDAYPYVFWLELEQRLQPEYNDGPYGYNAVTAFTSVRVHTECVNTVAWLKAHGIDPSELGK